MPENHTQTMQRERWGTKLGVIFAVAGSAVGLGNFLRFPGVVVKNGGGVFMIPYFLAFLLVGIPICWAEWTLGRRGGRISGLSSSPGVFGVLGRGGILKYFGVLGVFIPVIVFMYYVYVESWCLSYACFSATGSLGSGEQDVEYGAFFSQYTNTSSPPAVTAADITDADLLIATLRQPRTQAQQSFKHWFTTNAISCQTAELLEQASGTAQLAALRTTLTENLHRVLHSSAFQQSFETGKGATELNPSDPETLPIANRRELHSLFPDSIAPVPPTYFRSILPAYGFFLITFLLNFVIIYRGISRGIERFCLFALPLLIVCALIIAGYVATQPGFTDALGFMWNPHGDISTPEGLTGIALQEHLQRQMTTTEWTKLLDPEVWLAAVGQIFFTLSVGFGIILTYASYLSRKDDIVLSGLTASVMNTFCEVTLAGIMIVPAAILFLGITQAQGIAQAGTFGLGFITMPRVFQQMPGGQLMSLLFYVLLFLAGITSSLSMLQPVIAFLEEGFGFSRRASVALLAIITFMGANAVILGSDPSFTILDTLDNYAVNLGMPLMALLEVLIFVFVLGASRGLREAQMGASMSIPRVFPHVMSWVTLPFLLIILGSWFYSMRDRVSDMSVKAILTIVEMVVFLLMLCLMVHLAWPRMQQRWNDWKTRHEGSSEVEDTA